MPLPPTTGNGCALACEGFITDSYDLGLSTLPPSGIFTPGEFASDFIVLSTDTTRVARFYMFAAKFHAGLHNPVPADGTMINCDVQLGIYDGSTGQWTGINLGFHSPYGTGANGFIVNAGMTPHFTLKGEFKAISPEYAVTFESGVPPLGTDVAAIGPIFHFTGSGCSANYVYDAHGVLVKNPTV